MSQSSATVEQETEQETAPKPVRKTRKQQKPKTRRQPPYAVILHNDDLNTMPFVVGVLQKVFGYGRAKSVWLMMKAHHAGCTQVWSGAFEVAELKADQIRSCGPDPIMSDKGAQTLRVSLEPLE